MRLEKDGDMGDLGVNFRQLRSAVEWSIKRLETPRRNRVDAIKEYVGMHYADGGAENRMPTNFLELAVTIYVQQLAARPPRCTFKAKNSRLKPFAYETEIALNQIPEEIGLGDTIRRAVMEALFSFAVVKVGICLSKKAAVAFGRDAGETFADLVSIDDYFCDMSAKSCAGMQFQGDDYWLPIDDARAMW